MESNSKILYMIINMEKWLINIHYQGKAKKNLIDFKIQIRLLKTFLF